MAFQGGGDAFEDLRLPVERGQERREVGGSRARVGCVRGCHGRGRTIGRFFAGHGRVDLFDLEAERASKVCWTASAPTVSSWISAVSRGMGIIQNGLGHG